MQPIIVPNDTAALETALEVAGCKPCMISREDLTYQRRTGRPIDLGGATGIIVGGQNQIAVYAPHHGAIGKLLATIAIERT